jgi:hypothetical protein
MQREIQLGKKEESVDGRRFDSQDSASDFLLRGGSRTLSDKVIFPIIPIGPLKTPTHHLGKQGMASRIFSMASPSPPLDPSNPSQHPRSHTIDVIEHRIDSDIDGIRRWRQKRKTASAPVKDWYQRQPYHEYVHQLVIGGWENLQDLDTYLTTGPSQQPGVVVSVLDITDGFTRKCWPDIHNEYELKKFMSEDNRMGVKVRFYMAEYVKTPATCIIEALGSGLGLDPRFFNWCIGSRGHVFSPSQRHRAPYISLGFGVLDPTIGEKTDCEKFKVLVYIQVRLMEPVEQTGADFICSRIMKEMAGLVSAGGLNCMLLVDVSKESSSSARTRRSISLQG